jgi:hypothetical protein
MSLEEIAEKLNLENVPTIHGTNRWTAASVRKAFVSRSALEGNEVRSTAGALSRGSELVEPQHEFLDLG